MRISDWSSDVCSSDLTAEGGQHDISARQGRRQIIERRDLGRQPARRRLRAKRQAEIGRATCRDRVCQYVSISVVAGSVHKQTNRNTIIIYHLDYVQYDYTRSIISQTTHIILSH